VTYGSKTVVYIIYGMEGLQPPEFG